ncbi:uncharacterized protein DUF4387 [Humitalea rosea]|uniref:Uncharacterized protein DUF4387 n=2 Tax=Humitalea rosea TaxID=990373 RepID=A0A2W7HXJ4_9PROT|nr:uncharacterized protein DUF4387 [Humitalea rosea]
MMDRRNMATLRDMASTIRSKNAGVDHITFDIIFRERANFERVRDAHVLSPAIVAGLLRIPESRVTDFVVFEPANAIKFTILRERPSGSPGERDVFGSQQYAPLFDVEVP